MVADPDGNTQLALHQTVLETLAKPTSAHASRLEIWDELAETLSNLNR
jgi:hypothetical protein